MTSRKINFPRKNDFQKKESSKKRYKGSRLGIVFLLLGTILLSSIFWLKTKAEDWWQKLIQPSVYKINKTSDKELIKILGIKPNLTNLEGARDSINLLTQNLQGDYGLYFYALKQKQGFGIKENQVFKAASINKIPIIVSFYQLVEKGDLDEEAEYVLKKEDIQDYGAGSMRYQEEGTKYKYSQLVELIGKESDNTAAYVLAHLVGEAKIQDHLNELGMEKTSMKENTTTPQEMGDYLVKLYQNDLITEKYKEKVLNSLIKTDFEDRLPKGVPDSVEVAHKTGNEVQVYNDCGLILGRKPYVLCILTNGVLEEESLEVIPKISRLIWEFVNQ